MSRLFLSRNTEGGHDRGLLWLRFTYVTPVLVKKWYWGCQRRGRVELEQLRMAQEEERKQDQLKDIKAAEKRLRCGGRCVLFGGRFGWDVPM
jgi:hypothetical protein